MNDAYTQEQVKETMRLLIALHVTIMIEASIPAAFEQLENESQSEAYKTMYHTLIERMRNGDSPFQTLYSEPTYKAMFVGAAIDMLHEDELNGALDEHLVGQIKALAAIQKEIEYQAQ